MSIVSDGGRTSIPITFDPGNGNQLTIDLSDLHLRLAPVKPATDFVLCTAT